MPEYRFTSSKAGKSGPHLSVVGTALSPDDCSCEPPRIKVLCIDDDANSLLLMERCLRQLTRYEAQITTAGSIHLARTFHPANA